MTSYEFIDWADPPRSAVVKSYAQNHRRRKVRLQAQAADEAQGDRSRDVLARELEPSTIARRGNATILLTPEPEDADWRRSATDKDPGSEEDLAAFGKIEYNDGTTVFRSRPTDSEYDFGESTRYLRIPGAFFEHFSKLCDTDQRAIRFYLSAAPAALWQVTVTSPINAVREWFFPAFSQGPLSCDGASYYSLFCKTFAVDLQPSTQLLKHRGRVFRSISKTLQDPAKSTGDEVISTLAHVVAAESRLDDSMSWQAHYQGLLRVIELRGGYASLNDNMALAASVAWMEFSIPNRASLHNMLNDSAGSQVKTITGAGHLDQTSVRGFCHYLLMLRRLSQQRATSGFDLTITGMLHSPPLQRALFHPVMPVRYPNMIWSSAMRRINRNCQLVCLIYINYVLCISQNTPQASAAFLRRILKTVSGPIGSGANILIFVLMKDIEREDINRLWVLVRAMQIVHRLKKETCDILHQLLLDMIQGLTCAQARGHVATIQRLIGIVQTELSGSQDSQ